jgi:hypothetical protein
MFSISIPAGVALLCLVDRVGNASILPTNYKACTIIFTNISAQAEDARLCTQYPVEAAWKEASFEEDRASPFRFRDVALST